MRDQGSGLHDGVMIEVQNLTKRYGATTAVDDLSFTVEPGIVTGFLGPNGAGKSTTMRMILGLDEPTSGTARVNGRTLIDTPSITTQLPATGSDTNMQLALIAGLMLLLGVAATAAARRRPTS